MPWNFLKSAISTLLGACEGLFNPPARYVLRRDPRGAGSVKPGQSPVVNRGPFKPRPADVDGISVFLGKHVDPMTVAAAGQNGAAAYYVIRIKLSAIKAQGLTVVRKEVPGIPPGHAVIPELHFAQDAKKISAWGAALSLTIRISDVFDGSTGKWLE